MIKVSSLRLLLVAIACLLPIALLLNFHVISTSYKRLSDKAGGTRSYAKAAAATAHEKSSSSATSTSVSSIDTTKRKFVENTQTTATATAGKTPATEKKKKKKKRVAYAITVTKDGHFVDGALVLGYSALRVHNASKGFSSEYEADLVAFVAPTVVSARPILSAYGWKILERGLPVPLNEIENQVSLHRHSNPSVNTNSPIN